MYTALRDEDPVHHVADGDYWVLSRFADVFAAARDTATFSSAQGLTLQYDELNAAGLAEATPMVMLDPPEHTAFRRLVAHGFTPRQVAAIEPAVRSFVVERLEGLRRRGGGDIVAEVFKPLPSMVVAHYLGVPEADRARFDGWTDAIVAANAKGDPLAAPHAVSELFAYFTELIERRRQDPGEDTISQLLAAGEATTPVPLLRILGFAFTMVAGGNDTTTGLLGGSAELLGARRDQRDRAHRATRADRRRGRRAAPPHQPRAGPGPDHDPGRRGRRPDDPGRSAGPAALRFGEPRSPASSARTPTGSALTAGPARS